MEKGERERERERERVRERGWVFGGRDGEKRMGVGSYCRERNNLFIDKKLNLLHSN